jgi:hypothetical protein
MRRSKHSKYEIHVVSSTLFSVTAKLEKERVGREPKM